VPFVSFAYEPRFEIWFSIWRLGVSAVVAIAIAVAIWRSPSAVRRASLFWLGWLLLALLPTSNLLVQEAQFAERYVFLALLGMIGIVAALVSNVWERGGLRQLSLVAGGLLVIAAVGVSMSRSRYFDNDLAFLQQWTTVDPQAGQAQLSLGEYYFEEGSLVLAKDHLIKSLRTNPDSFGAHNGLGNVLAREGDIKGAVTHYEAALRAMPDYAKTHRNLGVTLSFQGEPLRAEEHCRRALELQPGLPGVHYNLGFVLERVGKPEEADLHFKQEAARGPQDGLADRHDRMARGFADQGKFFRAAAHFEHALRADRNHPSARQGLEQLRAMKSTQEPG
jgi:Tfp pilus assembly protein PilF